MGLRMKNFYRKIQFLGGVGGGHENPIYRWELGQMGKKGWLGHFADLSGTCQKRGSLVVEC